MPVSRQSDSEDIKRINISGQEHIISLFADDIMIYLDSPNMTFTQLMHLLYKFGELSGYKINVNKTQILTFNYTPSPQIKRTYQLKSKSWCDFDKTANPRL